MANIEITICVFEVSNSFLSKSFNGHLKTESIHFDNSAIWNRYE